ncbi:MAG: hypothetical protein ACLGIR_11050 [Actinomycetes bacterium]
MDRTDRHEVPDAVEELAVDLTSHRPDVCRRLLERGLSVDVLRTILPEWDPWIVEATVEA